MTQLPKTDDVRAAFFFPTYADNKFPAGKMVWMVGCQRQVGMLCDLAVRRDLGNAACQVLDNFPCALLSAGRRYRRPAQRRVFDLQCHPRCWLAQLSCGLQTLRAKLHTNCECGVDALAPGHERPATIHDLRVAGRCRL
jgi:hypothetical protein